MTQTTNNDVRRLNGIRILWLLILFCACSHAHAKNVDLHNTEIRYITAKENNVKYKLFISLPDGYNSKKERYPVLYLLDPDEGFSIAENIARNFENSGIIKPLMIVGIGYQNQEFLKTDSKIFWKQLAINRTRDDIPFHLKSGILDFETGESEYKGLAQYAGGSEKFKNFIKNELIPYIDSVYRTSKEHALTGHSLGGLFATWMILNDASIFQKYLILSPSLWIEKGCMIKEAYKLNTEIEIKAYFAVGSLEHDPQRNMVRDLKLFYSQLPKRNNFEFKMEIIEDENHVSMMPEAFTKGFKFLFKK